MSKNATPKIAIAYPYLPNGRTIQYVEADNPFMLAAQRYTLANSLDKSVPTGSVIVKDGVIIGSGANGSSYHESNICERVRQNIPTGQGYDLCEGCHPKNHSEAKAVDAAISQGHDTHGADLYLWGHWWCCEPCWGRMLEAGIQNVYLQTDSHVQFNKAHPENTLGGTNA
jgi:deoxycytidylate deaminase